MRQDYQGVHLDSAMIGSDCSGGKNRDPRLCTLHGSLSMNSSKAHNGAPHPYTRHSCKFPLVALLFVVRRLFVCGGSALTAIITATSGSRLNSNLCRDNYPVIVEGLARSLHVYVPHRIQACKRSLTIVILLASHRIYENSSLHSSSPVLYCSAIS